MAEKYLKFVVKFAEIVGKLAGKFGTFFWAIPSLVIMLVAFVVGLALSFGGDLGKFKKVAKQAMAIPTNANFQATAKLMPIAVRKQYKEVKLSGKKPSDVITLDACVYTPYNVSGAARFPALMTAFGLFSILLTFAFFLFGVMDQVSFVIVVLLAIILRLIAGAVSRGLLNSGVKIYHEYVDKLDNYLKVIPSGEQPQPAAAPTEAEAPAAEAPVTEAYNVNSGDIPFASADEPIRPKEYSFDDNAARQTHVYGATFEPERIEVEEVPEEPVVMAPPTESEEEIRARARAEAMARARAEQAQRAQAAQAARPTQTQQAQTARPTQQAQSRPQASSSFGSMNAGAEDVIARINKITQEGAPLATMKEAALQLQKERAKPENKTPDMQRKLNEALAALLKAMSSANKK